MTQFAGRYRVESARRRGWNYTHGWYFVTLCTRRRAPILGSVRGDAYRLPWRRTLIEGAWPPPGVSLSRIGRIVAEEWCRSALLRPGLELDAWVVMPDHLHGIVRLTGPYARAGGGCHAGTGMVAGGDGTDAGSGIVVPDAGAGIVVGRDEPGAPFGIVVETPRRGVSTIRRDIAIPDGGAPDRCAATDRCVASTTARNVTLVAGSLGAFIGQFKAACTRRLRDTGWSGRIWQPRYHDRVIPDERALHRIRHYIGRNPSCWRPPA